MKPAIRIIAALIGWYALHDAFGLIRALQAGISGDTIALYLFTASLSISLQSAVVLLMAFRTEQVLEILGVDDNTLSTLGTPYIVNSLAVMLALYMAIEGATFAVTAYASARMEFAEAGIPYGNFFTTNLFDWGWQDFIFGLSQSVISSAALIALLAYNKKLQPTAKASAE